MTSEARRNVEVCISKLNNADKKLFSEAKEKELDQWISNAVFKVARRAGVPHSRIMPMRWVLTWKNGPDGSKAKARLVVKGFTDPDLVTLRAEAPTLSKQCRHLLLQLGCTHKFTFEMGDVKTAFLQGEKTEKDRDIFLELVPEIRKRLRLTERQLLRLMGSAYGLRTAPRSWFRRVQKDLISIGWRQSQLDQCVFVLYDENENIIGLCGVYVDDFLIAGDIQSPRWKEAKSKLLKLYQWGKWEKWARRRRKGVGGRKEKEW